MIYKDPEGKKDKVSTPAERNETCLHCGEYWGSHEGWACAAWVGEHGYMNFDVVPSHQRYLTQAMKDSILQRTTKVRVAPGQPTTTDISDWRAWAHNRPGECKCGIAKVDCRYHKDQQ